MSGNTIGCVAGGLLSVCLAGTVHAADLKDHVSQAGLWNGVGILDHFLDPNPGWSAAGAAAIIGNGEELSKVGIVWAHASAVNGTPNGGDIHELQWVFRFFPDTASFSLAAMVSPPAQPNWGATFAAPSNGDWQTVIGSFLPFDLRYAEVDVSGLHVRTTAGALHLVALVPQSKLETPGIITAVAMSTGGAGAVGAESDWYHRGSLLGAEGPGPLAQLGENESYVAYRVTTVDAGLGDFDDDGDVDLTDFAGFQACFNGPNREPARPDCGSADFDDDNDVDLTDFASFQSCFNGPNRPAACE